MIVMKFTRILMYHIFCPSEKSIIHLDTITMVHCSFFITFHFLFSTLAFHLRLSPFLFITNRSSIFTTVLFFFFCLIYARFHLQETFFPSMDFQQSKKLKYQSFQTFIFFYCIYFFNFQGFTCLWKCIFNRN